MKNIRELKLSIVFAAVYFFSLNGVGALPHLGLNFLLKNQIKLTPSQLAYFQAVTLLAWVVKPLWGFISDYFPLFGSRRKSYLLISSFLAMAAWLVLAGMKDYTAGGILLVISLGYIAYAFQDVVTDGLMVETGQPLNLTGQFQSVQWSAVYTGMIITAFCGGYLSDLTQKGKLPFQALFGITSIFPFLTLLIVAFLVREPARPQLRKEAGSELKSVFFQKEIWLLSLFIFFWNFSPSFGAPFFFYAVDTLKFTGTFLGILQALTSFGALVGSILYGMIIAKIPVRKFLIFSVFTGVVLTLFNYIYFWPFMIEHAGLLKGVAIVSNFFLGMFSAVILLTLLNLAALTSPQYAGGTVFALIMSSYNLGNMGSSALGGFLFSKTGLQPLIALSAVFSVFVLFVQPFLPIPEPLTPLEARIKKLLRGPA